MTKHKKKTENIHQQFIAHTKSFFRRKYAETIPRPYGVRYNAYTQSIEVLDSKPQIENLMHSLNMEFQTLHNAFRVLKV